MTGVHPSWKVSPQNAPGPVLGTAVPFRALAHLVPSSSSLEERIIPGLTSLPPSLSEPKGSGGSSYSSSSAAIQPKGGLFQGGVPKLRPVGAKDSSGNGHRPVVCVGVPGEGPDQGGVQDFIVHPWRFQPFRGRTPAHIPVHGTGQLCPP